MNQTTTPGTEAGFDLDLDKLEAQARAAAIDLNRDEYYDFIEPDKAIALIALARRAAPATSAQPVQAGEAVDREDFAAWLAREMPADTVIGDPAWWAPRILARASLAPVSAQQGGNTSNNESSDLAAKAPAAQAVDLLAERTLLEDMLDYTRRAAVHLSDGLYYETASIQHRIKEAIAASPASTPEASQQADEEKLRALLESEFDCYRTTAGLIPWAINALLDNSPHRIAPVGQAAAVAAPIYQASIRGGWEDIEQWQFDLYNDKGEGSIKTRIVYAAPATAGAATKHEACGVNTSEDAARLREILDAKRCQGYEESCMEGGGVYQEESGPFIRRTDAQAIMDEAIAALRATQQEGE